MCQIKNRLLIAEVSIFPPLLDIFSQQRRLFFWFKDQRKEKLETKFLSSQGQTISFGQTVLTFERRVFYDVSLETICFMTNLKERRIFH